MRFHARLQGTKAKAFLGIPFDPDAVWRPKDKHFLTGTLNGCAFRGAIEDGSISIGAAWRRDNGMELGDEVVAMLDPEGPLTDNVAADLAIALNADEGARRFFDSLPTFYRNNFVRDIESAKTPTTRAKRIDRAMQALRNRQRST